MAQSRALINQNEEIHIPNMNKDLTSTETITNNCESNPTTNGLFNKEVFTLNTHRNTNSVDKISNTASNKHTIGF